MDAFCSNVCFLSIFFHLRLSIEEQRWSKFNWENAFGVLTIIEKKEKKRKENSRIYNKQKNIIVQYLTLICMFHDKTWSNTMEQKVFSV